jgi:hypothetical protein
MSSSHKIERMGIVGVKMGHWSDVFGNRNVLGLPNTEMSLFPNHWLLLCVKYSHNYDCVVNHFVWYDKRQF